jgi:hypothetical protein
MRHPLSALLSKLKAFLIERYRRIGHAYDIFKMRFILLAVKTHINLPDDFTYDEARAVNRGRQAPNGKHYSSTYALTWQEIPEAIQQEIKKFDTVLRLYFGGEYLINTANVWRNIGIPDEYRALDIYSQVWHYDHVVDYRNVQLFVLLTDTTEQHGPFEYLANASETEVNRDVEARNGAELVNAEIGKLTGVRGDGILFSTGATPHRAGIPKHGNHRDIFSIAFFPAYTGLGINAKALFNVESKT